MSTLRRLVSSLTIPVLFGGYMIALHYGWQKLQYNPIVNEGGPPDTITLEKFKKLFVDDSSKSSSDSKDDNKGKKN